MDYNQSVIAFLCTGNVLQHTKHAEKKTAKDVNRKVHFSHYMDALHSFQTFVCKQILISSTAHSVRAVHQQKVGLAAFDSKRWLCEDTTHTHSHGHVKTVSSPEVLTALRGIVVSAFPNILVRCDLPGTSY